MSKTNESKKTGANSSAETTGEDVANQLTEVELNKTEVDKAAAEALNAETQEGSKDAKSLDSALVELNNVNSLGESSPEVVTAAQAVYEADERRQSAERARAQAVVDAKNLATRRIQEGAATAQPQADETEYVIDFEQNADGFVPKEQQAKQAEVLRREEERRNAPVVINK